MPPQSNLIDPTSEPIANAPCDQPVLPSERHDDPSSEHKTTNTTAIPLALRRLMAHNAPGKTELSDRSWALNESKYDLRNKSVVS